MPKILRKTQKIFAGDFIPDVGQQEISQFGSLKNAAPIFSVDPDIIQNANYLQGWKDAVITSVDGLKKMSLLQDTNSLFYLLSRNLAYLLQAGLAEYDAGTTYYVGDLCRAVGTTSIYKSIVVDNTNNALSDVTKWTLLGDLSGLTQATETQAGIAEIATQAEMTAGTNDTTFSTPLKVKTQITNQVRLGTYDSKAIATNYLADYDGFLVVTATKGTTGGATISIYSDANPVPLAIIAQQNVDAASGVATGSLTAPIRKGNYYSVGLAGVTSSLIFFIKLLND